VRCGAWRRGVRKTRSGLHSGLQCSSSFSSAQNQSSYPRTGPVFFAQILQVLQLRSPDPTEREDQDICFTCFGRLAIGVGQTQTLPRGVPRLYCARTSSAREGESLSRTRTDVRYACSRYRRMEHFHDVLQCAIVLHPFSGSNEPHNLPMLASTMLLGQIDLVWRSSSDEPSHLVNSVIPLSVPLRTLTDTSTGFSSDRLQTLRALSCLLHHHHNPKSGRCFLIGPCPQTQAQDILHTLFLSICNAMSRNSLQHPPPSFQGRLAWVHQADQALLLSHLPSVSHPTHPPPTPSLKKP
jgi:hypothetical protein